MQGHHHEASCGIDPCASRLPPPRSCAGSTSAQRPHVALTHTPLVLATAVSVCGINPCTVAVTVSRVRVTEISVVCCISDGDHLNRFGSASDRPLDRMADIPPTSCRQHFLGHTLTVIANGLSSPVGLWSTQLGHLGFLGHDVLPYVLHNRIGPPPPLAS
ncbi:hypothetical protein E2562_028388 [Oryza meyeriana var. granulata]|uniref:Uncharacterized protein n=1 Tax=Oryza meyeriana var. granulata TaxID=110450 RepID=A0A6G1E3N4_9ORYZ|nr:hypothetical protein E2562_028388 [Oryza meyeriana var. granulata]